MRVEPLTGDVEILRPLAFSWLAEQQCARYGVHADVDVIMRKLAEVALHDYTSLIVLWDRDEPVGLYAVFSVPSMFGRQTFAFGLYWYVLPRYSGNGIRLLRAAKMWAEERGCSHFMPSVSRLAGNVHDEVCELLEKDGYRQFETIYVIEV